MARSGDKLLPSLGILLVTGGLVLLGWFAYLWFSPVPVPYQYELVKEGDNKAFPELELDAWPDLQLKQYNVSVEGVDKPIAAFTLAQKGNTSPVLLDWKNNTHEVLHTLDWKLSELSAVATAISKHTSKDALILSWWDTSRQINLLTGRETLFTSHMNEPLVVPLDWAGQSGDIKAHESKFWQSSVSQQERDQFEQFTQALTATPEEGAAKLRALVGSPREAYIVVHTTDLYKLGLIYPDKLGVAYQNLPLTGNMHGMINQMKVQLKNNDFDTYTLQSITDSEIRVFFLSDAQSSETLLAQMLPFTEKDAPLELKALQLMYQSGSYWVFNIP
ncbi:MAG: hydroxylamine oxidation protein HaoB [Nitrosomonas sp.]|nr:hydroxylamine oxidation protein HaoB [Nitrosomonas sp.]